jgi:predicted metal-binding membrane protein
MMLPATASMAVAHARDRPTARGRATLTFVAGYLLAWSAAGLVAYALIEGVRSLDLGFLAWDEAGRYVAGGAILAAALFQLTPAKDVCLRRCRDPLAARSGLEHGVHCVACCWALMAALFALGVMSIAWMAFVAALIAAERLLPSRLRAKHAIAVVLAVLGLAVLIAPGDVPGLTLPDSQDAAGMNMTMEQ